MFNIPYGLQNLLTQESVSCPTPVPPQELKDAFPSTGTLPICQFVEKTGKTIGKQKVGVLFSGGPAPGGHNVVYGLYEALQEMNPLTTLIGFLDGPSGVINDNTLEITREILLPYINRGGFDLLGSGRTRWNSSADFEKIAQTLKKLELDVLVIIGGDDSHTNGAYLAEYCASHKIPTQIIGIPKTIDNDLPHKYVEVSFGFDTATTLYSQLIRNIELDLLSTKKHYFFIKMMGRSASHIVLSCALKTHPNLALIAEEISKDSISLPQLVEKIASLIVKRAEEGKNYGIILLPEGIFEAIPEIQTLIEEMTHLTGEKSLETVISTLSPQSQKILKILPSDTQQLLIQRDPHGNLQLSKIESERLLIDLVKQYLANTSTSCKTPPMFNPVSLFFGYEGRCADPTDFDSTYTYSLGRMAGLVGALGLSGYLCTLKNLQSSSREWKPVAVPLVTLLGKEKRGDQERFVIKKQLVDLDGEAFRSFHAAQQEWETSNTYPRL